MQWCGASWRACVLPCEREGRPDPFCDHPIPTSHAARTSVSRRKSTRKRSGLREYRPRKEGGQKNVAENFAVFSARSKRSESTARIARFATRKRRRVGAALPNALRGDHRLISSPTLVASFECYASTARGSTAPSAAVREGSLTRRQSDNRIAPTARTWQGKLVLCRASVRCLRCREPLVRRIT